MVVKVEAAAVGRQKRRLSGLSVKQVQYVDTQLGDECSMLALNSVTKMRLGQRQQGPICHTDCRQQNSDRAREHM